MIISNFRATGFFLLAIASVSHSQTMHNLLSKSEKDSGFTLLFDGKTINDKIWKSWENPARSPMVKSNYAINTQEEALQKIGYNTNGDIMIDSVYGNFVFKFEFKVTSTATVGNSGITYRAFDGEYWASGSGIEYQIMDISDVNAGEPTSAAYGIAKPLQSNYKMNSGTYNTGMIVANGDSVEHWLNGKLTVGYNRASQKFKTAFSSSRFSSFSGREPLTGRTVNFQTANQGWVMIQDYGNGYPWWFRNMKMARLPIPIVPIHNAIPKTHSLNASAKLLNSSLHISIPEMGHHTIKVMDASGKTLFKQKGNLPKEYVWPTNGVRGILLIRVDHNGALRNLRVSVI